MIETRPKKGRPTKPAEARRDVRLPASRVTVGELANVEANAALAGITTAEFVRRAALGVRIKAKPPATTERLIFELNAIGNNLNQITARMHLTGELADSLPTTLAEVSALIERLADDGS